MYSCRKVVTVEVTQAGSTSSIVHRKRRECKYTYRRGKSERGGGGWSSLVMRWPRVDGPHSTSLINSLHTRTHTYCTITIQSFFPSNDISSRHLSLIFAYSLEKCSNDYALLTLQNILKAVLKVDYSNSARYYKEKSYIIYSCYPRCENEKRWTKIGKGYEKKRKGRQWGRKVANAKTRETLGVKVGRREVGRRGREWNE